jgi:hypothetical protein
LSGGAGSHSVALGNVVELVHPSFELEVDGWGGEMGMISWDEVGVSGFGIFRRKSVEIELWWMHK